ncbi:hypothetical protein HYC85_008587 [Camellia sinensis]|uniref:Uncharacterized protein n=1 Tax=Camellia sinensis TaxID=4442 RepID=A0A7J7HTZ7_CAMSI|nr:hypothetical protein HYC85_008587 [Camellia sinensis]
MSSEQTFTVTFLFSTGIINRINTFLNAKSMATKKEKTFKCASEMRNGYESFDLTRYNNNFNK